MFNKLRDEINNTRQINTRRGILGSMAVWSPLWIPYTIGFFCTKIIRPLKYGYLRFERFYRFLNESQWWSRLRLEQYQNERLRLLLRYAYKNVPYYEDLFRRNKLSPDDFCSIRDLEKLPVLTKEEVISNFDKLIARNIPLKEQKKRFHLRCTSGSTGKPMFCYDDDKYHFINLAIDQWWKKRSNIDSASRYISLWSKPFVEKNIRDIKLYEPYYMRLSLSNMPQSIDRLEEHLKLIKAFKPVYIRGSPSFLYALACYGQNKGFNNIHFRVFYSYYENLYQYQKEVIEGQFQCEIFRWYATEECSIIAIECNKHAGMHIESRKGVLEIIDEAGNVMPYGKRGRIIYTRFNNFVMPLIRYELGDIGIISDKQCLCGMQLPLLESLDGRTGEIIKYRDKHIYPATLSLVLERSKNIKECQFIQEVEDKITVLIVKRKGYSEKDSQQLIKYLKKIIDDSINIEICFVDYIPSSKMGKFSFVISKLKNK